MDNALHVCSASAHQQHTVKVADVQCAECVQSRSMVSNDGIVRIALYLGEVRRPTLARPTRSCSACQEGNRPIGLSERLPTSFVELSLSSRPFLLFATACGK